MKQFCEKLCLYPLYQKDLKNLYEPSQILKTEEKFKYFRIKEKDSKISKAMKAYKLLSLGDEHFVSFFSQFYLIRRMNHPVLMKVEKMFRSDKSFYFIFENVDINGTDYFNHFGCLGIQQKKKNLQQILEALSYLHS